SELGIRLVLAETTTRSRSVASWARTAGLAASRRAETRRVRDIRDPGKRERGMVMGISLIYEPELTVRRREIVTDRRGAAWPSPRRRFRRPARHRGWQSRRGRGMAPPGVSPMQPPAPR